MKAGRLSRANIVAGHKGFKTLSLAERVLRPCSECGRHYDPKGGRLRSCSHACRRAKAVRRAGERLLSRVSPEPNTGCWLWTGSINRRGYGKFQMLTADGRRTHPAASRAMWLHFVGPIPDGLFVCHRCDNRLCVNLDHLFLGTLQENLADRDRKGRQARGDRHGMRLKQKRAADAK